MIEKSTIDRFIMNSILSQRSSCQLFYRPLFLCCSLMGENVFWVGCSTSSGHWEKKKPRHAAILSVRYPVLTRTHPKSEPGLEDRVRRRCLQGPSDMWEHAVSCIIHPDSLHDTFTHTQILLCLSLTTNTTGWSF